MTRKLILPALLALTACGTATTKATPEATKVVVSYSAITTQLSVPELQKFASTGEKSSNISTLLAISHAKPEQVRQVLNKKYPTPSKAIQAKLNSQEGEDFLTELSKVIPAGTPAQSKKLMKQAILTSATDNSISVIEFISSYGAEELKFDAKYVLMNTNKVGDALERFSNSLQ